MATSELYQEAHKELESLMPKEQFDRLPELFKEIITITQDAEVVFNNAIINIDYAKYLLQRKRALIEAAARQYGYTLKGDKLH